MRVGRHLLSTLAALVAVATIAAACSGGVTVDDGDAAEATPSPDPVAPDATPTAPPTPPPTPTPEPDPPGRAELAEDQEFAEGPRLAVQGVDGQIFTMVADGSNQVPLTDASDGRVSATPTWSIDANRLAWVATDEATGDTDLRTARFDGSAWTSIDIETQASYLAWDPSGRRVATLGADDSGLLQLGVAEIDQTASWEPVDEGTPYWFSWSPDADGFLVHASGLRLDFVPLDGPTQVLEPEPGLFQAPLWLNGAVELIYADEREGEQFMVVAGGEGSGRRALVSYDGYLQFAVAPLSGLVALHVIDPSLAPVPDVITASYQAPSFQQPVDPIDPVPRNELTLMALFGGDPFVLYPGPDVFSPLPVLSFHWSPDGNSLAWLLEVDPGDGDCASETAVYRWEFWANNNFFDGPEFIPTPTFACQYLPGFDQFEQSVTYWSPDAALFTYAGTDPFTGERGIWNVPVGSFLGPELVAEGEIAVWSPQTPGTAAASSL